VFVPISSCTSRCKASSVVSPVKREDEGIQKEEDERGGRPCRVRITCPGETLWWIVEKDGISHLAEQIRPRRL
jgi:hypothetical protein